MSVLLLARLGDLGGAPAFEGGGESTGIWRVPAMPGYLFKRYTAEVARTVDAHRLDQLAAQPAALHGGTDRALARSVAWPHARVVDAARRTVGVVIPEVPDRFLVTWRSPRARAGDPDNHTPLYVDYLAQPNWYLSERGIPEQGAADRVALCSALAGVAALLERCGIVYADWSYSNAFWHPVDHTVFLIDVDGASYGSRPYVQTVNFDDPLTPPGRPVDTYTDRYRAALLIARCLTARREVGEVLTALRVMSGAPPAVLLAILTARDRTARPGLTALADAFGAAVPAGSASRGAGAVDATGVLRWEPVRSRESGRARVGGAATGRVGVTVGGAGRPPGIPPTVPGPGPKSDPVGPWVVLAAVVAVIAFVLVVVACGAAIVT